MRSGWNLLTLGMVLAFLLICTGCGKTGEASSEANQVAAIRGSSDGDAKKTPSSPSSSEKTPTSVSDPLHPVVEIQTNLGNIVIELDKTQAKLTVENFLRYVESGHYDQTIFHQVLKDYVIMGGAYTVDLVEKRAHPPIRNEAQKCALRNVAGTIAMVRRPDAQDTATCQFFINVADNPNLDYRGPSAEEYGYCPFGKVVSGMDVVRKIAAVEVTDKVVQVPGQAEKAEFERVPKQPVVIQSVRLVR